MRSLIFCLILLYLILNSFGERNESFWKIKTNLVLTSDITQEGVQLCTSMEDELMENAEGDAVANSSDNTLGKLSSTNLIELVITNQEQEEVTLFVTETVYNLIYRKPDLRKNPNIFHRAQIVENTDKYISSGQIEPLGRAVFIKKHHHSNHKTLPIINFNYSNIQFSISSVPVSVSKSNSNNSTNDSEIE